METEAPVSSAPITPAPSAPISAALERQSLAAATAPGRVLVVDDEPSVVELLLDCLSLGGYDRVGVTAPREALELLRTQRFDVMICDLMMPGMSGIELMVKARLEAPEMAILAVTAVTDIETAVRAMRLGAYDYLEKPVSPGDVAMRVASALETRRTILESRHAHERLTARYDSLQQLSAVKDNLVHMLVHDLKTPLSSAMGYIELLESKNEDSFSERQLRYLQRAYGSCRDVLRMTTTMLDLSRLEHGALKLRREPIELAALLREAAAETEPLLAATGGGVVVECPPDIPRPLCDGEIVRRVLSNLLSNAAKHSPPGGAVQLRAEAAEDRLVAVSVADGGKGIAPEDRERIFEKFQQLEAGKAAGGAGIGLAFCRMAVEAHGGSIWVESAPGQGCTFFFTLPLSPASTGAPQCRRST